MGIFGAGNAGSAITNLVAPLLVVAYGWRMVPQVYSIAMLIMAVMFWLFTYPDPKTEERKKSGVKLTLGQQMTPLMDLRVWRFGWPLLRVRRLRGVGAVAAQILRRRIRS